MITEQRSHAGYEHTDEFRVPIKGRDVAFQDYRGALNTHIAEGTLGIEDPDENYHGGKRWILREVEAVKPTPTDQPPDIKTGAQAAHILREIQCQLSKLKDFVRKP